ncbi:hypothetical protein ASPWEDRAFT_28025 [Aspergillus wentii DTO 134E9]|uniref:Fucose-specific lectin n=1 Tax=Aspergillus wentii DTO 134E9 TaxID=1073089 RepID=A0A1L9RKL7_ASPWE|nr:uncharacterized protein ASPWEDRAFT_28025 [Aspergillus wentii DTO 134E9]OJJ35387.1 hypothetical protein ASPWEDRAFT_28025 [Aspergillus wentii DTO 134E9]
MAEPRDISPEKHVALVSWIAQGSWKTVCYFVDEENRISESTLHPGSGNWAGTKKVEDIESHGPIRSLDATCAGDGEINLLYVANGKVHQWGYDLEDGKWVDYKLAFFRNVDVRKAVIISGPDDKDVAYLTRLSRDAPFTKLGIEGFGLGEFQKEEEVYSACAGPDGYIIYHKEIGGSEILLQIWSIKGFGMYRDVWGRRFFYENFMIHTVSRPRASPRVFLFNEEKIVECTENGNGNIETATVVDFEEKIPYISIDGVSLGEMVCLVYGDRKTVKSVMIMSNGDGIVKMPDIK